MSGGTIRILHVDDDGRLCDLVESLLEEERETFEVVTETDPEGALAYLESHAVDCVVSDYDMPGMDGLALLEAVRETYPDLPFILFTGKGTEEIASRAISAGVTDYLQKETGSDQYTVLANRIENAVDRRERERQFGTLVDNLPGVVYRGPASPDGESGFIAGEVEDVTGYTAEELAGKTLLWRTDIVHPEDDDIREDVHDQLATDGSFEVTYRIVTAGGETRWVWERGKQVGVAADGDPLIEGVVSDITERKQSRRELQEEKQFIEQALDALNDVFFVITPDGDIERWNSKANEFGYTDAEIAEMDAFDAFPEAHHTRVSEAIEEVLTTGQATVEADFLTADGERVPHELTGRTLTDTDGSVRGIAGIGRDITERKRRERELERYEQFVEYSPDFFVLLDSDMTVEYQSPISPLSDWEPRRVTGDQALEYIHEDDHEKVARQFEQLLSNPDEIASAEYRGKQESGEWVWVESRAQNFIGDEPIDGVLATLREITERKQRERELQRQNARLEEFASVVSHDLQNPLNVAKIHLGVAAEETGSDHVAEARQSLDRMEQLIDDLLALARQGQTVGETAPVGLRDIAEQCWRNVDTGDAHVEIAGDATVRADEGRLQRLFENLFHNAVAHGGDAVTVTLGTLPEGDGFYVEDDGRGIPAEERDEVFESGYSTREDGTGFGLAIVEQIADAHGWDVRVTEGEAGGARFEIAGVETGRDRANDRETVSG